MAGSYPGSPEGEEAFPWKVTDVWIRLLEGSAPLLAFATVTINHAILFRGVKVNEGSDGLFVTAFAVRRTKTGFSTQVEIVRRALRDVVEEAVLAEFRRVRDGGQPEGTSGPLPSRRRSA